MVLLTLTGAIVFLFTNLMSYRAYGNKRIILGVVFWLTLYIAHTECIQPLSKKKKNNALAYNKKGSAFSRAFLINKLQYYLAIITFPTDVFCPVLIR
jgi:hypothetical protein